MKRLLCGLLCIAAANAAPGVYTVLSGTGLVSFPGATVIATQAAIGGGYYGFSADSSFNYYIAGVSAIKKVTPGGVVTTLATAPANSQWMATAIDASGNIIVADNQQHEVWRISPNGSSVVAVANYPTCTTNLDDVYVRIDGAGNYIIATDNCSTTTLARITPAGAVTAIPLSTPINSNAGGLTLDGSGNYVVVGYTSNAIYSVTPAGQVSTLVAPNALLSNSAFCITYDPGSGNFVVCSAGNATLFSVTPGGAISTLFSGTGLAGVRGVVVTTPGTPAVPTTPVPPSLLLTMTALLALTGFWFWKKQRTSEVKP